MRLGFENPCGPERYSTRDSFESDNLPFRLAASSLKFLSNHSCTVQDCSTGSVQDPAKHITEPIKVVQAAKLTYVVEPLELLGN